MTILIMTRDSQGRALMMAAKTLKKYLKPVGMRTHTHTHTHTQSVLAQS